MAKGNLDLTSGNVYKTLLSFALPFMIANFIQALYGAVDMAVVGWFSSSASIAAVSIGTQIMQILTSLISGLTMGGTILIAQYVGAKRDDDVSKTVGTMFTLFAAAAIVFTVLMAISTKAFLNILKTPVEAFADVNAYVMICAFGIFFIFGYNAVSAVLRGMGDSKRPLIFVAIACVVNIAMDILLVGGMGMGAAGAALATVASQGISLILSVIYLRKRDFVFDFRLKSFKVHQDKMKKLFKLGLPVSLQETTVSLSFLFIAAIVNSLGVVASAAIGIAGKFEMFAMLPATAFSGAVASITAQNIGAGQPERAKKTLKASVIMAFVCSLAFFAWAQLSPESIMRIFKADVEVTLACSQYLRSFSFDFMLVAFGFCLNGFFNGCGRTAFSMVNGILSSVFIRVPLAYFLSVYVTEGLLGIGMAAPIATLVSVVVSLVYLKMGRWRRCDV